MQMLLFRSLTISKDLYAFYLPRMPFSLAGDRSVTIASGTFRRQTNENLITPEPAPTHVAALETFLADNADDIRQRLNALRDLLNELHCDGEI